MEQTRNSIRGVLPKPVHTAPTRYRDPQTGQTWSGRGRQPRWLNERIRAGATLDEFLVARGAQS